MNGKGIIKPFHMCYVHLFDEYNKKYLFA
jgi:hypothetical protein